MKKIFVLFRHGQTDYNLAERLHGQMDIPLNETGRKQAEALTPVLQEHKVEVIFSSTLSRALETAKIAAEPLNLEINKNPMLVEANFGEAEGKLWSDVQQKYPEICKNLFKPNVRMTDRFPGGESKEEIADRMFAALISISDAPENIIGISSHGALISRFLQALGRGDEPMANGEAFVVEYVDGKFFWIR